MRVLYAARRGLLIKALFDALGERVEVLGAQAELHVTIRLRELAADAVPAVIARAAARGMGIYPASPCYVTPPRLAELLLGHAGLGEQRIRAEVRAFAEAIAALETAR